MPIINLQRRLREAGRIRIGEKVEGTNQQGKRYTRPGKLDTFRLTSSDGEAIEAAAAIFGGTARKWDGAPAGEQWEVTTERTALAIVIPPTTMAWSQWMELWSGGGCVRRCDGENEVISEGPCLCDPEKPDCKPHSRLSVILSDLRTFGTWRLDTQGWNAAVELAGTVEVIQSFAARGKMLPARLLLEQRQKITPGEKTKYFAVPVLDVEIAPAVLTGAEPIAALPSPSGLTPVPPHEIEASSVAEQAAAVDRPVESAPRANAAQPLPSTGIKPRPALQAAPIAIEGDEPESSGPPAKKAPAKKAAAKKKAATRQAAPTPEPASPAADTEKLDQVKALCRSLGDTTKGAVRDRIAKTIGVSVDVDAPGGFLSDLSDEQLDALISSQTVPTDNDPPEQVAEPEIVPETPASSEEGDTDELDEDATAEFGYPIPFVVGERVWEECSTMSDAELEAGLTDGFLETDGDRDERVARLWNHKIGLWVVEQRESENRGDTEIIQGELV